MITKGIEYVEEGVRNYEARIKQRELKLLTLLANKHQGNDIQCYTSLKILILL
jgi:hypothetical protein